MHRVRRRKVASKEKVFGCDLQEHLAASSQEIPHVLRVCSEFIEEHGVVDGIYRLSGVSSNIQKLRSEFDNEASPDLHKDLYLQDIHCVSSLCKAYFRELPNPLLTYNLYDKFAEAVAIQLEEERLVKIRDVLKELPALHYRTLEFLMCHLVKMASHSSETNMHSRNLAIVWAPNLLRSKDIESSGFNGTAAFMEVRVQSIVVEFILTHVSHLFDDQDELQDRRTSLPSATGLCAPEEPVLRELPQNMAHYGHISPGDGPIAMRPYHAIIEGTDKRKGSLKGRKWMSIFNIGGRFNEPWRRSKNSQKGKDRTSLRPARSMDSLTIQTYTNEGSRHPVQQAVPRAAPSTQTNTEQAAPAPGATGGSGYAVTYRRGTGALGGSGGTQGTYSPLDPEGHGGGGAGGDGLSLVPSRSPGQSSAKLGRRAAMHISGPHLVTVPLHITSHLALGVLQGGGGGRVVHCGRERDGGDRAEGRARAGGMSVPKGEKKMDVDGMKKEQEVKVSGGDGGRGGEEEEGGGGGEEKGGGGGQGEEETAVKTETLVEDKKDKLNHMEEELDSQETGKADVQSSEEEEKEEEHSGEMSKDKWVSYDDQMKPVETFGGPVPDGEQGAEIVNSELQQDVTEDTEDEYMDMKGEALPTADPQARRRSEPSETEDHLYAPGLERDDHELSGYVQDNFDFLDHVDCSVSHQVNEFSVEPPGYEDDEYEEMEAHPPVCFSSPQAPPAGATRAPPRHHHRLSEPDPPLLHPAGQRHAPLHSLNQRHIKSLSLPASAMGRRFSRPEYTSSCSSSSSDDDEGGNDEDGGRAEDSDDEDEDDDDGMFYKSLPSSYAFAELTWSGPDGQSPTSRPPAHRSVEVPGQASQTAAAGETRSVENERAARSRAAEEKEGDTGNETQNQRSSSPRTNVDIGGDLHQISTTKPPVGGADPPPTLRSEPAEAWEHSLQTKVTGTEAATEVSAEGGDVPSGFVIGSLEVATPPSPMIETPVSPDGAIDVATEFCDDLPDPPSDFWFWEDEGMNGVEVEAGQVRQKTNDAGEETCTGAPGGEPERAKGYDGDARGPEADVCTLAHKSQDGTWEMVQWPTEPSEGQAGSADDIEMIPRDGEQQSGEGETELQFTGLPDAPVIEERTSEHKEVKMVQKDEAGIAEAPVEGSGKMFEETTGEDQSDMEDDLLIESDSREERVPCDKHARGDGKIQDEQGKMSVSADGKVVEAFGKPDAPETETKGARLTRPHSQPPVSTDRKAERTSVRWRDARESEQATAKERSEVDRSAACGKGVGRKLVISHPSPTKVYQVRSVPIVPPKPQHCRLTALNLRQQQQQNQQSEGRIPDREREWKKETPQEDISVREGEAVAEGKQGEVKQRKGLLVAERQRGSSDWEEITVKDAGTKHNPHSMCFDEAVAKATMRREREREGGDRERQKDRGCE